MWRISLPLLLVVAAAGVAGLRDVQVSVPEAAAAGDTVTLQCKFELDAESLYSVKWYKGRQEFFRYIPKELPHTRVFPLENIDVDVSRSGQDKVVLRAVTPSLSGRYRCEVSADAPYFHTAMKTSYMHVVELPESAPIITPEKTRASVGDVLRLRCTAPSAHPPANLTWFINGKIVKGTPIAYDENEDDRSPKDYATFVNNKIDEYHIGHRPTKPPPLPLTPPSQGSIDKQGTDERDMDKEAAKKRSASLLVFPVGQDAFPQGQLQLSCRASVFTLYAAQTTMILDEEKPQIALILGNKQSVNGGPSRDSSSILLILMTLAASLFLKNLHNSNKSLLLAS